MKQAHQVIRLTQQQLDGLAAYDFSIPTGPRLNRIWKRCWGGQKDLAHTQVAHVKQVEGKHAYFHWMAPIIVNEPEHQIIDSNYLNEKPPYMRV